MSFKTIIVEDEPLSRAFLNSLLAEFCPDIKVVATVPTEDEAVKAIDSLQPDLVFLDIELQQGTGFEVLKRTSRHNYHVVFTTAIEHYGIRAIRFSAVDYLQKPIDIEGLRQVIASIDIKQASKAIAIKHLIETLNNNNDPVHLGIPCANGTLYTPVAGIVSVEAAGDNCIINTGYQKITGIGRSIKDYEQLLADNNFFRPHPSFLINLDQLTLLSKPETGFVTMTDKSIVPVSPKRLEELRKNMPVK